MEHNLEKIYDELFAWCAGEGFAGSDPFDGLNSRLFQATPLKYFTLPRLAFLQLVKRSPKDLRPLLKVEKGVNPKGTALFALAELSRFRATYRPEHAENARRFLEQLLSLKLTTKSGHTAFGYNFDWQSRAFFAPKGTPTIVPTAFAAQALLEASRLFGDQAYVETARDICRFITDDLNRTGDSDDEICFSYTPLDRSVIFNASLLAAECLASTAEATGENEYHDLASKAARYVVRRQKENGLWAYGPKLRHAWVDNFHTAYILLSLCRLSKSVPAIGSDAAVGDSIGSGMNYWLDNFFLDDGTPKYFDKEIYPVDIHSASAAVAALAELREVDDRCLPLARKVADWTVVNMRDESGYFYYQKRPDRTVKIPFIRWSQAWTAYALARLIEEGNR